MQWNQRIVTISLLYPLHPIAGVGENFFAGSLDVLGGLRVEGEGLASLTSLTSITSILVDEINRAQRAVFLHLTDDTTHTITIVGIVFLVEGNAIIAHCPQLSALRDIPAYALMHNGNEVVGLFRTIRFLETLRYLHLREEDLRIRPSITIL